MKSDAYVYDPGRVLPPDEKADVTPTITPVEQVKSKTCKRESTNCFYRLGRW